MDTLAKVLARGRGWGRVIIAIAAFRSIRDSLAASERLQPLRRQLSRIRAQRAMHGGPPPGDGSGEAEGELSLPEEGSRAPEDPGSGAEEAGACRTLVLTVPGAVAPFLEWAPPGHFYSAIPDPSEAQLDALGVASRPSANFNPPDGVDLNGDLQVEMFDTLAPLARELEIPRDGDPAWRFRYPNPNFPVGDALFLGAFLRHLRSKRLFEIGSGWSTALVLDVNERFLGNSLEITSIEPHPEILKETIRPSDQVRVIPLPVQDVPLEEFHRLEENDILFVDCSHVVKFGSDVHHIVTRVLPTLPPGVVVFIHDIWWPFEYPRPWIEEGRAWTELYLVHAFLLYNSAFEVMFFNDWFGKPHRDLIERSLPQMLEDAGAGLWLRRRPTTSRSRQEQDR